MKLPGEGDKDPLTFFGLLDILTDFEERLRELEVQILPTSAKSDRNG